MSLKNDFSFRSNVHYWDVIICFAWKTIFTCEVEHQYIFSIYIVILLFCSIVLPPSRVVSPLILISFELFLQATNSDTYITTTLYFSHSAVDNLCFEFWIARFEASILTTWPASTYQRVGIKWWNGFSWNRGLVMLNLNSFKTEITFKRYFILTRNFLFFEICTYWCILWKPYF